MYSMLGHLIQMMQLPTYIHKITGILILQTTTLMKKCMASADIANINPAGNFIGFQENLHNSFSIEYTIVVEITEYSKLEIFLLVKQIHIYTGYNSDFSRTIFKN